MEVVARGFEFPEGPTWHPEGWVCVVNCHSDAIHRVWPDGRSELFAHAPGSGNGSTLGPDGLISCTDHRIGAIVRFSMHGEPTIVCDSAIGAPLKGPNDLVFGSGGTLFFTDPPGSSRENSVGCVYARSPSGVVDRLGDDFAFPNGIAIDPEGAYLYVAESGRNRIRRRALGRAGGWSVFAELADGGEPDGIRFDALGRLWVAHFGSGLVRVLDHEGAEVETHVVGGARPTNLEFGGADGQLLFVTDADTHTLRCFRTPVPGARFASGNL